ncbi:MAG: M15 family metallopeptidase [Bacteroidota bacterium]
MRIKAVLLLLLTWSCQQAKKETDRTNDAVEEKPVQLDTSIALIDTLIKKSIAKTKIYNYDTLAWTDILDLDSSIILDLKYATQDNFVKTKMYDCGRCFLRPKVAKAVLIAHQNLQRKGLGLKMFDCYRPRPIQWKLWGKLPDPRYVADPKKGSMHNRGGAVDLTIVDSSGNELDMGTPFDFFGREAYHAYMDLPEEVLKNRTLLKETMGQVGFSPITTEWWHYSFRAEQYGLSDMLWECGDEGE